MKMKKALSPFVVFAVVLAGLVYGSEAAALEIIVGLPYGKHTIGHTAVRVNTFDDDQEVIYDFGRYGKTWGPHGMQGEGVMRVWKGPQAVRKYLQKQTSYRSSIGYVVDVTAEEEKKIYEYYENQLEDPIWVKKYPDHTRYRLRKDYDGVRLQCTSVSLNGLKAVWPQERWESLLPPNFNKGQGFKAKERDYFFKVQKEAGVNEVVVPLDVVSAMENAQQTRHPALLKIMSYPQR